MSVKCRMASGSVPKNNEPPLLCKCKEGTEYWTTVVSVFLHILSPRNTLTPAFFSPQRVDQTRVVGPREANVSRHNRQVRAELFPNDYVVSRV